MRKALLLASVAACAMSAAAHADEVGQVFTLGEVNASAPAPDGGSMGGSTVTQDDIRLFNRETLDAAIDLVPGATVSEMGARNETDIWIRGFDRWRVALYQDGIPIYLPADNRIDYSQFTTADIGEVQISKGFTSVIDGPGAMGGSVNLVSRQVTKPFEGDSRVGASFDNNGAFQGYIVDAFAGTKQQNWYVQGAASDDYQSNFRLSDSFSAGTYQQDGNRDQSERDNYKLNFKVGYTPSATDEYAVNVIDQVGQKDNPPPDSVSPSSPKFWTWPAWDKQSVYWLSKTGLDDDGSYLKARTYYDRFYNVLDSYDSASYTTQNLPKSFDSIYDDRAAGGTLEVSEMLFGGMDNLKGSAFFRYDQHNDQESTNAKTDLWYAEPWLQDAETTYSVALENTVHPIKPVDVVIGASYDYRHMLNAQDWDTYSKVPAAPPYGFIVNYPVADDHAFNPELAVLYHYDDTGAVHASVSDRTRFPTLFEMFSSRFGTFDGNPYLRPEESTNFETGVTDTIDQTHLGATIFYSRVTNAIEAVNVNIPGLGIESQDQNVGNEIHTGFELQASRQVLKTLELGGNYSYLLYKILNDTAVATDNPANKLFLYANWKPLEDLSVVPNFEFESKKWLQSAANANYYYRGGDFAIANLKIAYQLRNDLQVEAGVKNLFDANYRIEDGYNAPGRSFFTNVRLTF